MTKHFFHFELFAVGPGFVLLSFILKLRYFLAVIFFFLGLSLSCLAYYLASTTKLVCLGLLSKVKVSQFKAYTNLTLSNPTYVFRSTLSMSWLGTLFQNQNDLAYRALEKLRLAKVEVF